MYLDDGKKMETTSQGLGFCNIKILLEVSMSERVEVWILSGRASACRYCTLRSFIV